jgi:hypothetical protein
LGIEILEAKCGLDDVPVLSAAHVGLTGFALRSLTER